MDLAGHVVDVGQHENGDAAVQRLVELGSLHHAQGVIPIEQLDQALGNVQVGRKVLLFRENEVTPRLDPQGARQQLEEVDRRAVGRNDLAGFRADQGGDLVADPPRRVDPVGRIPAADEPLPPLLGDDLGEPRQGGPGQRAERIPVEVDHALRDGKLIPRGLERILLVEAEAGLAVHGRHYGRCPQK